MPKMEVYFDYACPFCRRAHTALGELRGQFPQIEIVWRPCEAHPRPDSYGPHTDLCIRGMFFAKAHGVDPDVYNDRLFEAVFRDRVDIENPHALAGAVGDLLDAEALEKALLDGEYAEDLDKNNRDSDETGVWAVPAYRMEGRRLDAVEGVGVSKEALRTFMEEAGGSSSR